MRHPEALDAVIFAGSALEDDQAEEQLATLVTALAGLPVCVDEWEIDVAYSGGQKCLSCPPGASPLTLSDRAMAKVPAVNFIFSQSSETLLLGFR